MRVLLSSRPRPGRSQRLSPAALTLAAALLLTGCDKKPSLESQRLDQLEFKIQQLETRLNKVSAQHPAPANTKQPAGRIKSLTYRTGTSENRLRIYWADGSQSDLECTQEQTTLACG
ncbi:MAG: hypothetical protein NTV57_01920 [Cyanobacteria bacterium]|nr:hypothetical protein [Cyanobacteriota bacterium]